MKRIDTLKTRMEAHTAKIFGSVWLIGYMNK